MEIDGEHEQFVLQPVELVALHLDPNKAGWPFAAAEDLLRVVLAVRDHANRLDPSEYFGTQQHIVRRRKHSVEQITGIMLRQITPYVGKGVGDMAEDFLRDLS